MSVKLRNTSSVKQPTFARNKIHKLENFELQKKLKQLRNKKGLSQEELAEKTGLSLRTIQRIENGKSAPRGDTLRRLSIALQVSPDELIDWQVQEDKNVITMLNLSQLSFLAFPLLSVIVPLTIWILKKDHIRNVDSVGKSILNFQLSWTILIFAFTSLAAAKQLIPLEFIPGSMFTFMKITVLLYLYNLIVIVGNTIMYSKQSKVKYFPAIKFLN